MFPVGYLGAGINTLAGPVASTTPWPVTGVSSVIIDKKSIVIWSSSEDVFSGCCDHGLASVMFLNQNTVRAEKYETF